LSWFQATASDKAGTWKVVKIIEAVLGNTYGQEKLVRHFDRWWPDLEERLLKVPSASAEVSAKKTPPAVFDSPKLYSVFGLSSEDATEPVDGYFQNFELSKENINPVALLWTDPRESNLVSAYIPAPATLQVEYDCKAGSYCPVVGIHPGNLSRTCPDFIPMANF
jgi:hypothetical protein